MFYLTDENIEYYSDKELHRSGWQFVIENLSKSDLCGKETSESIFLDPYIDRTFHWEMVSNKLKEIIPYKKKWVGFLHHTFDTTFNIYNNTELFNKSEFIESLKFCVGIYVLSDYLKKQLIDRLNEYFPSHDIIVESLVHPTEFTCNKFMMSSFILNDRKKVIHVGGWLRNMFSIYKLHIPKIYNKVLLKGKFMDLYTIPKHLQNTIDKYKGNSKNLFDSKINNAAYRIIVENKYMNGMYEYIDELNKKVEIIEYLDNDLYDELFSSNIIFINLVDASAVNTIIECIVRNTPILVNKIPAVIEMLGEEYPFYYKNIDDIYDMLTHDMVMKTYIYLRKLDKSKFDISTFINSIRLSKIYK